MNYCVDCKHLRWGDTCTVTAVYKIDPVTKQEVMLNVNMGQVVVQRKSFIQIDKGILRDFYSTPCPKFEQNETKT